MQIFQNEKPEFYLKKVYDNPLENELLKKYKKMIKLVEMSDPSVFTDEAMMKFATGVEAAVTRGLHPSPLSCLLISCMKRIMLKLYGFRSLVPGDCGTK